ncbi:hypothetical protein PCS8203_01056 [Streptococcus pneumoniae PCS8203]|nr:hypothetical protein PCS8203_01056 [Streptococcus pneumoniae PCS8203]ELU57847.1 hypothetical protein PCS8106_01118 [Streptococcus pneumoniae PCS8106]
MEVRLPNRVIFQKSTMRNTKKLRQFGIFLLIILLSTYLPQTIGLYVTIILGLGADVYSLILTVGLVGSFLFY